MRITVWRRNSRVLAFRSGYATDRGCVRERNEDSVLASAMIAGGDGQALITAVADGVGGLTDGHIASAAAVAALREHFHPESAADVPGALLLAAVAADCAVREINAGRDESTQTGSTLVAAALCGRTLHIAHVGDSRAYMLRGSRLRVLTRDHTVVADAVRAGAMSEGDAKTSPIRNVLTRGLGAENGDIEVARPLGLRSGDRVLLCSDGIHGVVPAVVMMGTLEREDDPQCAAERLIQHAIDHGAPDNASAVVIRVGKGAA